MQSQIKRMVYTLGSAGTLTGFVAACVGGPAYGVVGDPGTGNDPNNNDPPVQTDPSGPIVEFDASVGVRDSSIKKDATTFDTTEPDPPTCKSPSTFTAPPINSPTTPTNVCTTQILGALADACIADPAAAACTAARNVTANKTCAACVFGSKFDSLWKVINVDGTAAAFNQAGCVDQVTGVPRCGAAYMSILRCFNFYCDQCGAGTEATTCQNDVKSNECKAYLLGNNVSSDDTACSNALQSKSTQIDTSCFAQDSTTAAEKTFFINIASVTCMKL